MLCLLRNGKLTYVSKLREAIEMHNPLRCWILYPFILDFN